MNKPAVRATARPGDDPEHRRAAVDAISMRRDALALRSTFGSWLDGNSRSDPRLRSFIESKYSPESRASAYSALRAALQAVPSRKHKIETAVAEIVARGPEDASAKSRLEFLRLSWGTFLDQARSVLEMQPARDTSPMLGVGWRVRMPHSVHVAAHASMLHRRLSSFAHRALRRVHADVPTSWLPESEAT